MAYVGIGRLLVKLIEDVAPAVLAYYLATEQADAPTDFAWRRCQCQLTRETGEDVVTNVFDFVNITSGAVDSTWTGTDYATVEARLLTFYNAAKVYMATDAHALTARWYNMPRVPGSELPPARVQTLSADLGPSGDALPNQVACTITKVVAPRRHWGRIYLGPMARGALENVTYHGRWSSACTTALANAFEALRAGAQADDFPMVVSAANGSALFTVEGTRVDDVPDVQRRRRPNVAIARQIRP